MVERVFTRDVLKTDGTVKFKAGEVKDFPRETWARLADSLSLPYEDFTSSVVDLARISAQNLAASGEKTGALKVQAEEDSLAKPEILTKPVIKGDGSASNPDSRNRLGV